MRPGKLTLLLAAATAGALVCTGAGAHGAMAGARAGGFGHFGGFHGFGHFHRHPTALGHAGFRFRRHFHRFGFRRFPQTTVTVAGDDYMDDYDTGYDDGDLADMHFRVQDSFGPWDVPVRPPVVAEPAWSGPWGAARMDPWHGYEAQDDW